LENLSRDPAAAYYADLAFLKPAEARRLLGEDPEGDPERSPVYEAVTEPYRRCSSNDPVQRAGYADLKVYLPNDPLVKVDRMSMAHSLEVRCPFLDRRLVELAFRIPAHRKQRGRRGKVLLRALARKRLPDKVWQLPKLGFTAPIGDWIAGASSSMYRDEMFRANSMVSSYVDMIEVERRFERHRARVHDHSYELWALWVLEGWLQQNRMLSQQSADPIAQATRTEVGAERVARLRLVARREM
jgi:asparagine synthase (glutamine-hydrolysing)